MKRKIRMLLHGFGCVLIGAATLASIPAFGQSAKPPNIVVIMGDDIGMWNIGAYHRGMMAGKTPNLDKLAKEGMLFTDYYAEASCTAGRAAFVTGELPIRTGMTTVGQAGGQVGLPAEACTIATALKAGLRHGAVRQEPPRRPQRVPAHRPRLRRVLRLPVPPRRDGRSSAPGYPQELLNRVGPRNMVHSGHGQGRRDRDAALGQGRQAEDRGCGHALSRSGWRPWTTRSATSSFKFIDKAKADGKPFFLWLNPTRMHIVTHLSDKYAEPAQLEERLVAAGSRHGAARRHRRRGACRSSRTWAWTTTPSSSSPPTTAPRRSPGRTAATRRSRGRRARSTKAASAPRR